MFVEKCNLLSVALGSRVVVVIIIVIDRVMFDPMPALFNHCLKSNVITRWLPLFVLIIIVINYCITVITIDCSPMFPPPLSLPLVLISFVGCSACL